MSTVAAVLTELLALPRPKRIAAVSKDLRSRRDRYGEIEAHALAAAVGGDVPVTRAVGMVDSLMSTA